MPNWVTSRVRAAEQAINALLNSEGQVDFNAITSFPGKFDWDGIYGDAETAAESIISRPLSDHPLVARLEAANRNDVDIKKMSDASFEQLIGMLRNFRECGYLHSMEFTREVWGTKWNACDAQADAAAGTAQFDTAWSCPIPVLTELSKRFPSCPIEVEFADEDIGSNCGKFTLLNGEFVYQDIAPKWRDMSVEQKTKWKAFAYNVKGWEPEEDEAES